MKRTERPHPSGATPIYNFDEWNEKHYGKAFQRSQTARKRAQYKDSATELNENMTKTEFTMLVFASTLLLIFIIFYQSDRSSNDKFVNSKTISTSDK